MQNSNAMQDYVINLLKEKISPYYYYHNYRHTLYVQEKAIEIGIAEGCNAAEIEWLSVAALWHDTGFIHTYLHHEQAGCILVREQLPGFGYTKNSIDIICGMIMATKIPQSPQTRLEEILADADLEYLGTAGVEEKAALLYKELQHLQPSLTPAHWHQMQINFLQTHQYFTPFCKQQRAPAKQAELERLLTLETGNATS
ncbi:MAG TPA: HD domain-containing protein [Chitinophagaceae bacterium]|nr:HD domain-containing protein [Chitinophagaceae bacterium]